MALLNKVSDGEGVLEDITRREALVSLDKASARIPRRRDESVHELIKLGTRREATRTMSKNGKCFFSLTISESSFH